MASDKMVEYLSRAQVEFPDNVPANVVDEFIALSEKANDAKTEKAEQKRLLQEDKHTLSSTKKNRESIHESRKENNRAIREKREELGNYKNRLFVGSRKNRKELKKQLSDLVKRKTMLKTRSKELKEKEKTTKRTITGRRSTIKSLKAKIKAAKEKFARISLSVKEQIKTLVILRRIKEIFKTVDINNPEFAEMITFFNSNKKGKISLDPLNVTLETPSPNLQALVTKEFIKLKAENEKAKAKAKIEKSERIISGVKKYTKKVFHASKQVWKYMQKNFLESAQTVTPTTRPALTGPSTSTPALPAGPSHDEGR